MLSTATCTQGSIPVPDKTCASCVPFCSMGELERIAIALARIFAIVGFGYFLRARNIFTPAMKGGCAALVTKIALPATIFLFIAQMDLGSIIPSVLIAVVVGKLVIFALAFAFGYALRSKDMAKFVKEKGTAGAETTPPTRPMTSGAILGLFCTVSSDPAFGGQFMYQLYPDNGTQIILFFAASLIVCCPIGFFLLEYDKYASQQEGGRLTPAQKGAAARQALRGVCMNPCVFMAVIGLIWNGALGSLVNRPFFLTFAKVTADAFPFPALFLLGVSAYGKIGLFHGRFAMHVLVVCVLKTVISPIVIQQLLEAFTDGAPPSLGTSGGWSGLTFIYGIFPTAPAVPLWAMAFKAELVVIAVAMIMVFFFAGVVTFVSVAIVVSPSNTHQSVVSYIVGGATIFFAVYLLLPGCHAMFKKRDALSAAPAFWVNIIAWVMLLLGLSWEHCETGTGLAGSWAAHEFLYLVLRLLVLAAMHEVLLMAEARSTEGGSGAFRPNTTKRVTTLVGILCFSILLVIVPALAIDDANAAKGTYQQCVLFGAAGMQRWVALIYSGIIGLLGTYLITALEQEHSRIRIPHEIWWDSASAHAHGRLSADGAAPAPAQKKHGMSDKFKLEVIAALIVGECVLTLWEVFEVTELGNGASVAAVDLIYILELTFRGMVVALFFLFYGFGHTIAGRFFNHFYGALASAASALTNCGAEAGEVSKLMENGVTVEELTDTEA
jgi:predicted permease